MQRTTSKAKSSSSYTRPKLQKSVTLSRKYVRRPVARKTMDIKKVDKKTDPKVAVKKVIKVETKAPAETKKVAKASTETNKVKIKTSSASFKTSAKANDLKKAISESAKRTPIKINKVERVDSIKRFNDAKKTVTKKVAQPAKSEAVKLTKSMKAPKPIKTASVKSAKASKASADAARLAMKKVATMDATARPMKKRRGVRFFIALGCSAAAVAGLVAFVVINLPNISVKVAAMQTGIDASYPKVIPRNYTMETASADKDNKVSIKYVGPNDTYFVLTEESSTWDSTAVLNNFVKLNYSVNYSTMHEQGITYYSDSGSAVWVNGGILYKLTSHGKNLTREQIRNLVVSM